MAKLASGERTNKLYLYGNTIFDGSLCRVIHALAPCFTLAPSRSGRHIRIAAATVSYQLTSSVIVFVDDIQLVNGVLFVVDGNGSWTIIVQHSSLVLFK